MATDGIDKDATLAELARLDSDIAHWNRRIDETNDTPLNSPLIDEFKQNRTKATRKWNDLNGIAWAYGFYA